MLTEFISMKEFTRYERKFEMGLNSCAFEYTLRHKQSALVLTSSTISLCYIEIS